MISYENKQIPVPDHPSVYQIRIRGHLDHQWSDWFDGMAVTLEDDGDTLLTGSVADQAALYGLLKKVRDLGMTLVSINPVLPDHAESLVNTEKNDQQGKGPSARKER